MDPCALAQDRPYYSYNLGDWHFVSLDSGSTSGNDADLTITQRAFLSSDLQADKHLCQAVYMHHPRYSAGTHGSNANLADDWQLMMDLGVDLVMAGHDHNYQRWTRMGAQNTPDAAKGIRQFVVGTGGGGHYSTTNRPAGLESFNDTSFGVLKLNLRSDAYDWTFLPRPADVHRLGHADLPLITARARGGYNGVSSLRRDPGLASDSAGHCRRPRRRRAGPRAAWSPAL